eukprot:6174200-Pleurochrysis_carterae.AAC.5
MVDMLQQDVGFVGELQQTAHVCEMPGKAISRGREAVQAAAAAAMTAAATVAAATVAPPAQEIDEAPKYDPDRLALREGNTLVLALKGIGAIGTGMDEPIKLFKMLLLPSGKSVRVPHCPGHFVVSNNDWADWTFPLLVLFDDKLKRKDKLAVAVLDYLRVHPDLQLISI